MFQLILNMKRSARVLVFMTAVGFYMAASVCFANDAINPVKTIEPPPSLTNVKNHINPETERYDFEGTLDATGDDWITVNDHQFTVEPGARIRGRIGSFVGLLLNDRGNVITCEPARRR